MRVIKFRQKLKPEYIKSSNKFHYWGYVDKCFVSPLGKNYCDCDSEQFTGLQDINGVDICEGDIVDGVLYKDYSVHIGKINYDFSGYRIVTKEKSMPLDLTEKLRVIGNIHENSELLK